jgi:hypothetical protein
LATPNEIEDREMKALKRASVGGYVQADVTGTGDWVFGRITGFDDKFITFNPADGSEIVKMVRSEVFKSSKKEYEEALTEALEAAAEVTHTDVQAELELSKEDAAEDEENTSTTPKNGVVDPEIAARYVTGVTANGRKSKCNGDSVAQLLMGKDLDEAYEIVSQHTDTPESELRAKYSHLNHGMQRMNIGNYLRRSAKK